MADFNPHLTPARGKPAQAKEWSPAMTTPMATEASGVQVRAIAAPRKQQKRWAVVRSSNLDGLLNNQNISMVKNGIAET